MNFNEKKLYHQIHPVKLITDVSTGLFTTYLLWIHSISWFLALFVVPSVIISFLLIKFSNLEKQKSSALGKYISIYMTPLIETVRLLGQVVMWIAAWFHSMIFILLGLVVIVGGWYNGLLFPVRLNEK